MVVVALLISACGRRDEPAAEVEAGVAHGSLEVGGRQRTYRVYVPEAAADGPVPLLVGLHGGMGSGDQFARANGIEAVAEREGFVVVHPDGDRRTWNGGVCCGRAAREGVDDVELVRALIDRLEADHDIDPTQVHVFGHSNGGIMAYRLACELSDRIAGIAAVAGTLGVEDCRPERPVSVLHVHGDADENLPIDGGVGPESRAGVDFPPPRDGFATLAGAAGCPPPAIEVDGGVTTERRGPCDGGTEAVFVTLTGAEHPWPAGPADDGYDATAELVAYLLTHPARQP
jgi:polyhydroxybutyrate depolymerase